MNYRSLRYPCVLADGKTVARLEIPKRLTQTDADRLSDFINTLVTENGTSVEPDADDPKNTGSKPERDVLKMFVYHEDDLKQ